MKSNNVIQIKSYDFAVRIVKLYQYLIKEKNEYNLSKQILCSGTSVGANIEEAIGGQSKKDFFAKITISYKEARETRYWLRLLRDTNYITGEQSESLISDIDEILKIIGKIQTTIKNNSKNKNL